MMRAVRAACEYSHGVMMETHGAVGCRVLVRIS